MPAPKKKEYMSLDLILGSMFSGKSTELIRRVDRLVAIGTRCLVVNHTNDTRISGSFVQTHAGKRAVAKKTDDLLLVDVRPYDAIAIDEAQFFVNLRAAVMLMVEKHGKHVIVAGLSGDYRRKPFGGILDLVPLADDVQFKRALCARCRHPGRAASFTKRVSGETVLVSVCSEYIAVCRQCYLQ